MMIRIRGRKKNKHEDVAADVFHVVKTSITSWKQRLLAISITQRTMSRDKGKENDRPEGMTRDDVALDALLHAHRTKKTQEAVAQECSKFLSEITNKPRLSREDKRKLQDVGDLIQTQSKEVNATMSKLSSVVAERSRVAHSGYVEKRLAREAKKGLVDDPTWYLPESETQAKFDAVFKKGSTIPLDNSTGATSSRKRRSQSAATKPHKKPPARPDNVPAYPPPQNATSTLQGEYTKMEAMKILHEQPKRIRNAWVREWTEKKLVPINHDNMIKNLRKFEKNQPQSEFWGRGGQAKWQDYK